MKKKIVGIFVCTLFIISALFNAVNANSNGDSSSFSNFQAPEPFWVTPGDGDMIYGNVALWAGENSGIDIMWTSFFYSTDRENWVWIGDDWDGTEIPEANSIEIGDGSDYGDGWRIYWDVSDMEEGWYYIKAQMWSMYEVPGCTDIHVYLDSTPPVPTIVQPEYDKIITERVTIRVTTTDENVDHVEYKLLRVPCYYDKGVELKCQTDYLKGYGPNGEDYGGVACAPTATASCLAYWNKTGFPQIMMNDPDDPSEGWFNQTELVRRLADACHTSATGTNPSNLAQGIRDFLNDQNAGCDNPEGLEVHVYPGMSGHFDETTGQFIIDNKGEANFSKYKEELEANNEDVLWGYRWVRFNATSGKWDRHYGHRVCGNSVNNTPLPDSDGYLPRIPEHEVDYMDPSCGTYTTRRMNADGIMYFGNAWRIPNDMITVSKKNKTAEAQNWESLGTSSDAVHGYPVDLDPAELEDGCYFLRAIMVDEDGNQGQHTIVVRVEKEEDTTPPIVMIIKPENGLYLNNNEILPFLIPFIIGAIDIEAQASDAESGMNKVEFYIDNVLQGSDTDIDGDGIYVWKWSTPAFFSHTIKVLAIDNAGNTAYDELMVWKFF